MKKLLILGILSVFVLQAAVFAVTISETPQVLPKGAIDIEAHVDYWSLGDRIDKDGNKTTLAGYSSMSFTNIPLELYYGLTDQIQLGVAIPYMNLSYIQTAGGTAKTKTGLGDATISGQLQLNDTAALVLDIELANGAYTNVNAISTNLGNGAVNYTLKGIFTRPLLNGTWYATLGYTLAGTDANKYNLGNKILLDVAADYDLGDGLNCTGGLYTSLGSDAANSGSAVANSAISSSALKLGLEKVFSAALLGRINYLLGVWGKNTFVTTRIEAGIAYGL